MQETKLSLYKLHVGSDDADFDKRLDALKKGKGATAYGKSRQDKQPQQSPGSQPKGKKKQGAHPELLVCSQLHLRQGERYHQRYVQHTVGKHVALGNAGAVAGLLQGLLQYMEHTVYLV